MSFTRAAMVEIQPKRRCARDEGLDRGRSPQSDCRPRSGGRRRWRAPRVCYLPAEPREGLRALERWATRFLERRSGRWRTLAVLVDTWPRGWQPQASRWWTCHPSFQHGCAYSRASLATPARTMSWTPSPPHLAAWRNERLAVVDPEAESEVLRLLSERREDLVAERTRAFNRLHGLLLRDLIAGGIPGTLSTSRAARILR